MLKSTVVTLVGQSPEAHGVGEDVTELKRTVYCTVKSIGMQEAYQAMGIGLNPELKVILAHDFEYSGEPFAELLGQKFKIIRTYITEKDGIELTLQRVAGNARGTGVTPSAE